MTPEHVSELQSILRFLRANAFEKSEAALVEEVEALMRAAQLEKDDAERRLRASASGNNDGADPRLNGEDPGSAREVSNDAFGPRSPPAVSRPILGRFGSDAEQARAAIASEDALEDEAAEKEARATGASRLRLDENAESVGALDAFATPIGGDSDEDTDAGAIASASEFAGASSPEPAALEPERVDSEDARGDDSAGASDDADDADASFASFANGTGRATTTTGATTTDDDVLDLETAENGRPAGTPLSSSPSDAARDGAFSLASSGRDETDDSGRLFFRRAQPGFAPSRDILGREDFEAQRAALRAWQTAPQEEYADFEDPGYVRVRAPRGRGARGRGRDAGDDGWVARGEEEASLLERAREEDDDTHAGSGAFAFDSSPRTTTPASERSEAPLGAGREEATVARMGWGGSEFGGDASERGSTPRSPRASLGADETVETDEKASGGETDASFSAATPAEVADPDPACFPTFETFSLKIVRRPSRTGFEAHKDFPVVPGELVAGRYRVIDVLGAAAFSVAVRAEDARLNREVCLKIVRNNKDFFDQSLDEVKLLRMMNEADANDEKNIVRMLDFFYHREHLFIVTELLGLNLYEQQKLCLSRRAEARRATQRGQSAYVVSNPSRRSQSPPASPERSRWRNGSLSSAEPARDGPYFTLRALRAVAKQVLVALEFMHARGVIHCDVKPENIVLRLGDAAAAARRVKVIDLGSSCFTTDHLSAYVQSRSYRAPEVMLGAPYDGKADLWSLGCVLAELFTGQVLLQNESTQTALARVIGIFGPLDPELLRLGKHSRALVTAAGVPYEDAADSSDDDASPGDATDSDDSDGTRGAYVLLPKRTSLAARLGLPPLGVARDATAAWAPNGSPASGSDETRPNRDDDANGFAAAAATRVADASERSVRAGTGLDAPTVSKTPTGSADLVVPELRASRRAEEEKDGFIEFLLLLLQPNPRLRPTAAQALAHEWLAAGDDDFEDAWVPPRTTMRAAQRGDERVRDILAQL